MPDELRSPLEKALVAQALSIQTPGGAWDPRALGTGPAVRKRGIEMAWIQQADFDELAFSSGLSVHQAEPSQVSPTPDYHPRGL